MSKLQPNFIAKAKQQIKQKNAPMSRTLANKEARRVRVPADIWCSFSFIKKPTYHQERDNYEVGAVVPDHRQFILKK